MLKRKRSEKEETEQPRKKQKRKCTFKCGTRAKFGPTKRKEELLRWIKYALAREQTIGFTTCVYLFYDGNDQTEKILVPF